MKRVLIAAACSVLLGACGSSAEVDVPGIEDEIQRGIAERVDDAGEVDVTCPSSLEVEPGRTFDCIASFDDGSEAGVTGRWQNDAGEYVWRVE